MRRQVGALNETLPALGAFVGFVSRVDSLMHDEARAPETFPAVEAFVGPLPRVRSLVQNKVGALIETLPALLAFIGLLSRVRGLRSTKPFAHIESFLTFGGWVFFFSCMGSLLH